MEYLANDTILRVIVGSICIAIVLVAGNLISDHFGE